MIWWAGFKAYNWRVIIDVLSQTCLFIRLVIERRLVVILIMRMTIPGQWQQHRRVLRRGSVTVTDRQEQRVDATRSRHRVARTLRRIPRPSHVHYSVARLYAHNSRRRWCNVPPSWAWQFGRASWHAQSAVLRRLLVLLAGKRRRRPDDPATTPTEQRRRRITAARSTHPGPRYSPRSWRRF